MSSAYFINIFKFVAMMKVRPPKPLQVAKTPTPPQAQGMLFQWFPQWWGWQSAQTNNNVDSNESQHESSAFDGELLDVFSDAIDDDTLLRRDTVFGLFNFAMSKGAISLCTVSNGEPGANINAFCKKKFYSKFKIFKLCLC